MSNVAVSCCLLADSEPVLALHSTLESESLPTRAAQWWRSTWEFELMLSNLLLASVQSSYSFAPFSLLSWRWHWRHWRSAADQQMLDLTVVGFVTLILSALGSLTCSISSHSGLATGAICCFDFSQMLRFFSPWYSDCSSNYTMRTYLRLLRWS